MIPSPHTPGDDRATDLLIKRAVEGLTDAETLELRALGLENDHEFDLAVASCNLACASEHAMPESLKAKILASALATGVSPSPTLKLTSAPAVPATKPAPRLILWGGWLAAAACLLIAALAWWPSIRPLSPEQRYNILAAKGPGVIHAKWGDFNDLTTGAAPEIPGVKGEVLWSEANQEGYMKLQGLRPNDPTIERYQLWIIDKRGLTQRVSGGVFDIPKGATEVVVPIAPALPINGAAIFAVTIEPPPGVAISDMSRRVCAAALGS